MTFNNKILTRKGYIINKKELRREHLGEEKIKKIKQELNVKPISHPDFISQSFNYKVYTENGDNICIPRYYGIKNFGKNKEIYDMECEEINIKFNGELREHQKPIVKECYDKIIKYGGGVISLHCGAGKTVLAIYLASILKVKTLVIVHKTFLQNQWVERIKQFTNAKIGIIRQNKVDVENKDIIIGMLQSISMKDYDSKIFNDIGLVIVDECHHISSRVFSKTLMKVGSKYTIGLSATPNRADGLTKVFLWYLGDIIYKLERKESHNVIIKMFNYESNNILFKEKKQWINGKVRPSTTKMITNICKLEERNKLCIDIINNLRYNENRKILVLSGRIDQLKILKNGLDNIIEQDIKNDDLLPDEFKTSFYIGGMKDYELDESAKSNVIFATYDMAQEGLDIDSLNTLLFASPKRNIIQAVGRILRKQKKDCIVDPLLIDINDNLSVFPNWTDSRKKYYIKQKYSIDYYHAYNDNCISIKDYLVIKKFIKKSNAELSTFDIRKHYLCSIYGQYYYDDQKDIEFEDEPVERFSYIPHLADILNV